MGRLDGTNEQPRHAAAKAAETKPKERARKGLLDGDARLRRLLALIPDAIFVNTGGKLTFVNAAAQELFGLSEAAMLGRSPLELIHVDSHELARARIAALTEGASDVPMIELKIMHSDGGTRLVESTAVRLDDAGETSILSIMRDVTQRRESEQEVLAGKAKLEAALASMNDAVLIADASGRFVEFNEAFVTVHRFRDKAECRRTLADYPALFELTFANGAPAPLEQWPVTRALRGETATNVEYTLRRKDTGAIWDGSYSFAPIRSPAGAIVGAVVTGRDISELKRMHGDLEASHADLRRLVAAMDTIEEDERKRVARDLHDDLGQTLAAARIKLAGMRDAGRGDAGTRDAGIGEAGNRASGNDVQRVAREIDALIASADRFARSLAAQLAPPVLYELGLVPALEWLAEELHANYGLEVDLVDDGAPQPLSPVVRSIVYRAVRELLINVAKHARVGVATVELAGVEDRLIVRVHDAGIGFDADKVLRAPGRGIGLASVRERVSFVGGTLDLRSIPDDGTVVELRVPLAPPAPHPEGTSP